MFGKKKKISTQASVPERRKRDIFLKPFRRDDRSRSPSRSDGDQSSPAHVQQSPQNVQGKAGKAEQVNAADPAGQQNAEGSTPSPVAPKTASAGQQDNISVNLWVEAHESLPEEVKRILVDCGIIINAKSSQTGFLDEILHVAKEAKEKAEAKSGKFKFGSMEIDLGQKVQAIICWIDKFKTIGDIVIQYDPVHAALPWAGVRFILQMIVDRQESMEAALIGIERITMLISQGTIYEQLYLTIEEPSTQGRDAKNTLYRALIKLYAAILTLLSILMRHFTSNTAKRILRSAINPGAIIEKLKALDGPESAVNTAAGVVESCYQAESRHFHKETFKDLKMLLKSFEAILNRVDTTVAKMYRRIEDTERVKILEWLSNIPYRGHHNHAQEGRVKGTGQWLFKRQEFQSWLRSQQSEMLWLHGIPGAGKTKLISAVIDHLQLKVDKVSFFYCKRDEELRRDRQQILLALVKQLACPDNETICTIVQEIYEKEQKDPSARKHLPFHATTTLLTQLVDCYREPIIVLDALDECPQKTIIDILDAFFTIMKASKVSVKVLVSSRHSLDIEIRMRNVPHVCIEARDNAQDIQNYVETELETRINAKRLLQGKVSPNLRTKIKEVLLSGANGMFLWVDYQLQELCNLRLERDVLVRLGKLPKDLTEVYHEIMASIKSQPGSAPILAERALKWMLVSLKPLRPEELCAASEVDSTLPINQTGEDTETIGVGVEVEVLLSFCSGLLVLDKSLSVVRFTHLSVQEYLETRIDGWGVLDAQLLVAEACLWILQRPGVYKDDLKEKKSVQHQQILYWYSANYWFKHCRSYQCLIMPVPAANTTAAASWHPRELKLLHSFLGSLNAPSEAYVKWVEGLYRMSSWKIKWSVDSTPLRPVFAAAMGGLGELISQLWSSEEINMDERNSGHVPLLHLAAMSGETWIVKHMLDRGAEVNSAGGKYGSALGAAACGGNKEIVALLLDRGADVNSMGGNYRTGLGAAAHQRYKEIVTLLLDRGADVNSADGEYGTVLGAVAHWGYEEIVTILLDRGADVNSTAGGKYGTALGAAAYRGYKEIVTLLLDRGADVNPAGGEYGTALGAAAYWGYKEIVTLLLGRGADVNSAGGKYGTALGAAAFRGHKEIVTLLVDRGADVNSAGGEYGTALGAAAFWGYKEIVTLLVDRGADVNPAGGEYGTALGAAAFWGYKEIVTLLLDRGADVNSAGGKYGTALCTAAFQGHKEIVTLLLDRGADVNSAGGEYGTALGAAAYRGYKKTVTLLLDRGADVNSAGGKYGTALGVAAYGGEKEIVTLLLDRGADVNSAGGYHGTALGAAAYTGNTEIITLLLDRGADVNSAGGKYGSALCAAAYWGHKEIVTLLLDRGADVNSAGGEYGTALEAAASRGHKEIVKVLLDRGANPSPTVPKVSSHP